MKFSYYDKHINKKTISLKSDTTTLTANAEVFQNLVEDLVKPYKKTKIDTVVTIGASGFLLASEIAYKLKAGLVPIRRKNRLATLAKYKRRAATVDYSKQRKEFEMNIGLIKNKRILLIDDWIETGAQIKTAIRLTEKEGGKIQGIATVYVDPNAKVKSIKYPLHYLNKE